MSVHIKNLKTREILDSRGYPTVELELLTTRDKTVFATVPSGASTGKHEAHELRDGGPRYLGKGVQKALQNIETILWPAFQDKDISQQEKVDEKLIELDSSENKRHLGANALLVFSLACAKASAKEMELSLFEYLAQTYFKNHKNNTPKNSVSHHSPHHQKQSPHKGEQKHHYKLPVPLMNVLNGGAHANNGLDVQEFMIVPLLQDFSSSLQAGVEVFHHLKKQLQEKSLSIAVGDEGGFAPRLKENKQAIEFLLQAIERAGYRPGEDIYLALDVAANEFYLPKKKLYAWEGNLISPEELGEIYENWSRDFPLISIEDPYAEDDWLSWQFFTAKMGKKIQIIGDDLFVTNTQRLKKGFQQKVANAILVKMNQIGTLTETFECIREAQQNNYTTVLSHRSGETEDNSIAHLVVGSYSSQIKTGSPCRSERTVKYNELLRILDKLHPLHTDSSNPSNPSKEKEIFWSKSAFKQL